MPVDFNCGYKKNNKPFGTMIQCIENGRVSRYGLFKADPKILEKSFNIEKMGDKNEIKKIEAKIRNINKKFANNKLEYSKLIKELKNKNKNDITDKERKLKTSLLNEQKKFYDQITELTKKIDKLQDKIDKKAKDKIKHKKSSKKSPKKSSKKTPKKSSKK